LERTFHELQLGGVLQYMFCSRSKRKTVEDEAGTKDGIEVEDDNMIKDWNHGLMIIRRD
jgi:hypothetical protein